MKTPKGGDRRPTFYSRRFCGSVCRRTKSFRRSRNVKGNFAWGSYGGFSVGSWRVLGTFSAESRQDLGEISPPLAMRCLGGPKTAPYSPYKDSIRETTAAVASYADDFLSFGRISARSWPCTLASIKRARPSFCINIHFHVFQDWIQ